MFKKTLFISGLVFSLTVTTLAGPRAREVDASRNNTTPQPQARGPVLPFTLDFFANGNAVEVDLPTDIGYSGDGNYILVSAAGTSPGMGTLSVYDATDLSLERIIPLTYAPTQMAIMHGANTTKAYLVNEHDDLITKVDYILGVETFISVGNRPGTIVIAPDDSKAVVTGKSDSIASVPWALINIANNDTVTAFDNAPLIHDSFISDYGTWEIFQRPVFLSGNNQIVSLSILPSGLNALVVADFTSGTPSVSTLLTLPSNGSAGVLRGAPDGSLLAMTYSICGSSCQFRLVIVDGDLPGGPAIQGDYLLGQGYAGLAGSSAVVKPDGTKVAVSLEASLKIFDIANETSTSAVTSGFAYETGWLPVTNMTNNPADSNDDHFLVWHRGAGSSGYQIFDWNGARVKELIVADLEYQFNVWTELAVASPTNGSHVAFVDPTNLREEVVLLDLNTTSPSLVAHVQCGDAVEGDRVIDLEMSADQSKAMMVDYTSNNAFFVNPATMAKSAPVDILEGTTAALLAPDGNTAIFAAGNWLEDPAANADHVLLVDCVTGTPTEVVLPVNTWARSLAMDIDGQHVYMMLADTTNANFVKLGKLSLASKTFVGTPLSILGNPDSFQVAAPLSHRINADIVLSAHLDESNHWFAQSPNGHTIAVGTNAVAGGRVTFVNADTGFINDVGVPQDPTVMLFNSESSLLYVACAPGYDIPIPTLHVFEDIGDFWVTAAPSLEIPTTGSGIWWPTCMIFSADGSKLYFGMRDSNLINVIDTSTFTFLPGITLPQITDFGFPVLNWNAPSHLRLSADGSTLYVFSLNDEVHLIDVATDTVTQTIATGFLSPTDVIQLNSSARSGAEQFLMASFNDANDGLALLTIGDVVDPCPADLDNNGTVNVFDLLELLLDWGQSGVPADIDGSGSVNVFDLLELLLAWGSC